MAKFPYEKRAADAQAAHAALLKAAAQRRRAPSGRWDKDHPSFSRWEALAAAFRKAIENALPPEFRANAEKLRRGDLGVVDDVIAFLEADPMYFRSGYLKADLVRWLMPVPLTKEQVQRLRNVVLRVVSANWRREFHRYCQLARCLDGPEFRLELQRLTKSPRADVRVRADRALAVLDPQRAHDSFHYLD